MNDKNSVIDRQENRPAAEVTVRKAQPRVDIYENRDEFLMQVEMPGVAREDIRIDLDNGRLSLTGRRTLPLGSNAVYAEFGPVEFHRTFAVPQTIDGEQVKAEFREGILNLHLPKSPAFRPRTIAISEA